MTDRGGPRDRPRRRVLMLCAHEPGLDPRIRWEAEAAFPRFDVTVLGFAGDDARDGDIKPTSFGRSILLPCADHGAVAYFWRLKEVAPFPADILLNVLLILMLPPLFLADGTVRLLGPSVRRLRVRPAASAGAVSAAGGTATPMLDARRGRFLARLYYVLSALRRRFSPATALFWDAIRAMPEKPDIVHCNDLDTLLVGVLAKRRYGVRLIYDAHEFFPHSDPQGKWVDIAFFSALERFLIRKADAVVTVNPQLGEAIRAAYRLDRVYSVPNAEPWVEGRPSSLPGSAMDQLARGRVKFLFQGRFSPGRGIEELIEGWTRVDGGRAALFLRGPDNLWRQALIELATRLGVFDRSVYFLDAVREDELVSGAAEADVGIIPYKPLIINDRLSCPNKLSQYLHAGLMVIANDLPYVKAVLTEAEAGLFYNSADPSTLAAAVSQVVDRPELLRRSRGNASRFARERFNWQVQAEILYALYRGRDNRERAGAALADCAPEPSA